MLVFLAMWCHDPICTTNYNEFIERHDETIREKLITQVFHCSTENCHKLVWTEINRACDHCKLWYCLSCEYLYYPAVCVAFSIIEHHEHQWICKACQQQLDRNGNPTISQAT